MTETLGMSERQFGYLHTPIGVIQVTECDGFIKAIAFVDQAAKAPSQTPLLTAALAQLREYFSGTRDTFDLPLAPTGTEFQQKVWDELTAIEFGQTASYRDVAVALNNPKGVRAVGSANGKNPIAIVIPCHRVIGANGTLTGYAGGLDRKAWLLNHESRYGQMGLL